MELLHFVKFSLFLAVVMIHLHLSKVQCDGQVNIKFKQFVNPGGKGDNGNCCDGRSIFCEINGCDHYFHICLHSAEGSDSMSACEYGSKYTRAVKNSDSINFGSSIGGTSNNFTFRFVSWPGSAKIKVDIRDKDKLNGNDYVDTIRSVISQNPHPIKSETYTIRDRCRLTFEMKVLCDVNWWDTGCATYCRPRDNDSGHYTCDGNGRKVCLPGWTGEVCDEEINECASSPCHAVGGSCRDLLGAYYCDCIQGYTGADCGDDIDECVGEDASGICSSNGNCLNIEGSFVCNCTEGYTGSNCSENINECLSSPCWHNNATCVDDVNSYICLCPPGFTGLHCNIDINECLGHSCLNNASCIDLHGEYGCECLSGYTGTHCEEEIDECLSSPCHINTSYCNDIIGGYICECLAGWTGSHCDIEINECESNPCIHGNCSDLINDYNCICNHGYEGLLCDTDIDDCLNVTCDKNNSYCVDLTGHFECQCNPRWIGENCSDIDWCMVNNCLNNGTCLQSKEGFTCVCEDSWAGPTCNKSKASCVHSSCFINGTKECKYKEGVFQCHCKPEWVGERCNIRKDDGSSNNGNSSQCICPTPTTSDSEGNNTNVCICNTTSTMPPLEDFTDKIAVPSAILFEGNIEGEMAVTISNIITKHASNLLHLSKKDISIKYNIETCKGEKGQDVSIYIFDLHDKEQKIPYSYIDELFETQFSNQVDSIFPLPIYNGEDCYSNAAQVVNANDGFPYWMIVICILVSLVLITLIIILVWKIRRQKILRSQGNDPVLVDHTTRTSRTDSDAVIISNDILSAPLPAIPLQDHTSSQEEMSIEEPNEIPKCFVNLMYEELSSVQNKDK